MSENSPAMAGGCPVGILIDLDSPAIDTDFCNENENEDPNDCIEISRSDEGDRRLSHTLVMSMDQEDRILKDVTDKVVSNCQLEDSPEVLIQDEIFDFDLVLSPNDSSLLEEQEEEVFFGPVGFREKLVSSVVPLASLDPMSPLNPKQMAEIVKEAHSIAYQFSRLAVDSEGNNTFPFPKFLPSKKKSPAKPHQRKGTFELEKPVETLLQDGSKIKIPSVGNQENVAPIPINNRMSMKSAAPVNPHKSIPAVHNKLATKLRCIKQSNLRASEINSEKQTDKSSSSLKVDVKSKDLHSKLKKPTTLTQVTKNRSYTLLPKVKSCENVNQLSVNGIPNTEISGESDTDSMMSDKSDVSASKLPTFKTSLPVVTKSVEPVDESAVKRMRQYSGVSEANSDTSSIASDLSDLSISKLPICNLPMKSSLPSKKSRIPEMGVKKQIPAVRSGIPPISSKLQPPKTAMPLTKAPIGTLQLVRPGQIQKSRLCFPRGKPIAAAPGPIKALVPTKQAGPGTKLNSVTNKPDITVKPKATENASLKTCQSTVIKPGSPLQANRLNVRTPIKSTSSSTSSVDTPSRRRSCLPTPSKKRLNSTSSIPPSPLTNRSSASSNTSTGSRRLLLSDGCDSPVFSQCTISTSMEHMTAPDKNDESPSGMQPQKHPVQNTPDVPKKPCSVWSPVRRYRHNSTDQHFQCTKRMSLHH
ncbi:flocculation protein FLO11-like isoform X2 [Gigantopelta aegis]|uniref:flocculation protein FLO11-like isoform X2 n=1 Tax=Gigantopelta aegis TaxID=1735272 RepID=UPI001B889C4B|nr:flocculation protein FLO11-like isoform X2 [Gigantopelta aegis]